MRKPATKSAKQIISDKLAPSPVPFNTRPEQPHRVHVQHELPKSTVHKHVRRDRPPLVAEVVLRKTEGEPHIGRRQQGELHEKNSDIDRD